jgi:hypothetical protein
MRIIGAFMAKVHPSLWARAVVKILAGYGRA